MGKVWKDGYWIETPDRGSSGLSTNPYGSTYDTRGGVSGRHRHERFGSSGLERGRGFSKKPYSGSSGLERGRGFSKKPYSGSSGLNSGSGRSSGYVVPSRGGSVGSYGKHRLRSHARGSLSFNLFPKRRVVHKSRWQGFYRVSERKRREHKRTSGFY